MELGRVGFIRALNETEDSILLPLWEPHWMSKAVVHSRVRESCLSKSVLYEANHLHETDAQIENCNNILAKERRLQFHQKGRSMNSTGSGKSSGTVSRMRLEFESLYKPAPFDYTIKLGMVRLVDRVQSTEGEAPHVPTTYQLGLNKSKKDQLLRTASQHSDSSGFAEDSTDCLSLNHLQVHESLQAMGSSADSCDSETTVTSFGEDLVTPTAQDQPYFNESEEESLTCPQMGREKAATIADKRSDGQDFPQCEAVENTGHQRSTWSAGDHVTEITERKEDVSPAQPVELLREASAESDVDKSSECEFAQYTTHHILKSLASVEAKCNEKGAENTTGPPSSVDRVNTALQRAQMKVCTLSNQRVGRSLIKSKDLLKQRYLFAKAGYPLRRSQSLPTTLLSPVRVVSSVNVRLSPGKETRCSPPSFTYKYTPEEEQKLEREVIEHDGQSLVKSTIFISPSFVKKEAAAQSEVNRLEECHQRRTPACSLYAPAPVSQSTCALHSVHSEWQEGPLCEHMRTLSTHSIPNIPGTACSAFTSPLGCPYSHRHAAYPYRMCSLNPPSAIEMQLRRVLHDIRNSLQNLSQHPVMRGPDLAAVPCSTQKSSVLPLYENTFQELQVMRRSLNLFRTQMMDLELAVLRQQTMVYHHMTEDEREKNYNFSHLQVTELMREQSYLRSELGLGLGEMGFEVPPGESLESVFSQATSESSSVCSGPSHANRTGVPSSDSVGRPKTHLVPSKKVFRASVALTPTAPSRTGSVQTPPDMESSEEVVAAEEGSEAVGPKSEVEKEHGKISLSPAAEEMHKNVEQDELQQVIRE
ncbi:Sperm-specific antigen 2, partial [Eschrichtius robustus]|nr:Sperm-specific antigen 2 [Eschrichtius robustus]